MAELKKAERTDLLAKLTRFTLEVDGHEGYAKVVRDLFILLVHQLYRLPRQALACMCPSLKPLITPHILKQPLSEVDCRTMESRLLPGVFICGEILDVFGRIGGFNFYWAWVSGRLAGLSVAHAQLCH